MVTNVSSSTLQMRKQARRSQVLWPRSPSYTMLASASVLHQVSESKSLHPPPPAPLTDWDGGAGEDRHAPSVEKRTGCLGKGAGDLHTVCGALMVPRHAALPRPKAPTKHQFQPQGGQYPHFHSTSVPLFLLTISFYLPLSGGLTPLRQPRAASASSVPPALGRVPQHHQPQHPLLWRHSPQSLEFPPGTQICSYGHE